MNILIVPLICWYSSNIIILDFFIGRACHMGEGWKNKGYNFQLYSLGLKSKFYDDWWIVEGGQSTFLYEYCLGRNESL